MSDLENQEQPTKKGKLFVVSTPIGNNDDISLRALKVLKDVDLVVAEEPKEGAKLLHKYNISRKLDFLNEQNEYSKSQELLELLNQGEHLALVSDCGTPVFADPGQTLVKAAINAGINVIVVPGVSSIMTALVRSTFDITQFIFAGFLSRDKDLRIAQLEHLKEEFRTIVLLETPYRLLPFLEAAASVIPERHVYIGCNLTMPFESHHYGTFKSLYEKFSENKFKGEFVIVFEGKLGDSADSEIFTAKELANYSSEMANLENILKLKSSHDSRDSRRGRGGDRSPRRDGNRDRRSDRGFERRDRPFRSDDRGEKRFDRDENSEGGERRFNRSDRSEGGERRFNRSDRGEGGERRFNRSDRGEGGERRFNRSDRSEGGERRFNRSDRSEGGERRFNRSDRGEGGERRFDRGEKRFDRGDRGDRRERDNSRGDRKGRDFGDRRERGNKLGDRADFRDGNSGERRKFDGDRPPKRKSDSFGSGFGDRGGFKPGRRDGKSDKPKGNFRKGRF